jgi:hypothetical protein
VLGSTILMVLFAPPVLPPFSLQVGR